MVLKTMLRKASKEFLKSHGIETPFPIVFDIEKILDASTKRLKEK